MELTLILVMFASIFANLVIIWYSSNRRDKKRAVFFSLFAISLFIYSAGYLVEITSKTADAAMSAVKLQNLGVHFIAPLFALNAFGMFRMRLLRPWMQVLCGVYGFVMFGVVALNDLHHLYYTSITLAPLGTLNLTMLGKGPLFYVSQVFNLLFVLSACTVLLWHYMRSRVLIRRLIFVLLLVIIPPFVSNMLNVFGLIPRGLDTTPVVLTASLVIFTIVMHRTMIMDSVPAAAHAALETMHDALILLENDWTFLFCNKSAESLFPALRGRQISEDVTSVPGWPSELRARTMPGQATFTLIPPSDGIRSTYFADISRITDDANKQTGWSILIRDVTDIMALVDQFETMAAIDPLTGTLNRRKFLSIVEREFKMSTRLGLHLAIIMFDIDRFKVVNDTHGHVIGDQVLIHVVDTIREQLRGYDIFSRYGGEEFVILTHSGGESGIEIFATRLRRAIEENTFRSGDIELTVTASFGAVEIPPGAPFDDAMLAADSAMYKAKAGGRNMVVVDKLYLD